MYYTIYMYYTILYICIIHVLYNIYIYMSGQKHEAPSLNDIFQSSLLPFTAEVRKARGCKAGGEISQGI